MISSATILGVTAMLASVLLSSAMPASATLKPCYAAVSGVGRGPTGAIAMNKAIQNWRINTEDAFGSYFADWSNAMNHGRSCKATGGLYYCRVHAKPCRSGSDLDGGVKKSPVTGD
jgi:hypothetical protein